MFKIISKGWKAEKYVEKCIHSVMSQKDPNWEMYIVLDPSDDETYNLAKKYQSNRIQVFVNQTQMFGSHNLFKAVQLSHSTDDDILLFLDLDDWLANENVLSIIKKHYLDNSNLMVTYGSWQGYPDPNIPTNNGAYSKEDFNNGLRKLNVGAWRGSHCKTMKYKVFKRIRESDFKLDGISWLGSAVDLVIMYAALEMVGYERSKHISDILYIYNRYEHNCDKDKKENQEQCAEYVICKIRPYHMILDFNRKNINTLIFSKDRSAQLDLLLRSIIDNFKPLLENEIIVYYKATTDSFKKGYEKLINKFKNYNFVFIPEGYSFAQDIKIIVNDFAEEYSLCLVDDEVVIRKPDLKYIYNFFNDGINGISLRMNPSIDYSYTSECYMQRPKLDINDGLIMKWNWTRAVPPGDWSYPSCINSHIRKTKDFKKIINEINFHGVNDLEAQINSHRNYQKPYMLAFNKSITISIPNNVTQKYMSRNAGKTIFGLENMNTAYLNGYIININNLYGLENTMPTIPVDFNFIQG
ncbi:MAG: glycosyltransferase family A protein [Candidatus Nanoarchaeia archaeon]|nr:glycosyltransferase family A protein [Candidatus Nanoarchaeia archaeon]